MELQIGWGVVGKLFIAGALTYVLAPALLVLRDLVLWRFINYFLINNRLHIYIHRRASDVWHLNNRYNVSREIISAESRRKFLHDGVEVTEEEFNSVERAIEFHGKRADRDGAEIVWRSNLVNWLLRHYKQVGDSNPIPEWQRSAYAAVDKRESDTVDKKFSA